MSFLLLFLVLGVRLAVGNDSIAFVVLVILVGTLSIRIDSGLASNLIMIYHIAVVILFNILNLIRFGLLAIVAQFLTISVLRSAPLTLDSQAWYYGHGMFFMALVCLLALAACYNAVGSRKIGTSSHLPLHR